MTWIYAQRFASRPLRLASLLLSVALASASCGGQPLRLIAFGDQGTGGEGQLAVAKVARELCASEGCDLALLLGDNFYSTGVTSLDDPQWQEKFEQPYAGLELPFYPVLGNHDYGLLANSWEQGPLEVGYSALQDRWTMPATFHTLRLGSVGFLFLDTNALFWDSVDNGDQAAWLPSALASLEGSKVIVAVGHHPIRSNGPHGDAGHYDQLQGVPPLDGSMIASFFNDKLCGKFDLYLAGHDHSRQWIKEPFCGAELLVSGGGGARPTTLVTDRNPTYFQEASRGLLYLTVDGRSVTGRFFDEQGNEEFSRSFEAGQ